MQKNPWWVYNYIYFNISKMKRKLPNKLTWQLDALSKLSTPAEFESWSTAAQSRVHYTVVNMTIGAETPPQNTVLQTHFLLFTAD